MTAILMQGDLIVIPFTWSVVPASLTVYARLMDGTTIGTYTLGVDPQVTQPTPGVPSYKATIDSTNYPGWWVVEARCPTGTGQGVESTTFYVTPRPFI